MALEEFETDLPFISKCELMYAASNVNMKSATGPDGLGYGFWYSICMYESAPLCDLYNALLMKGVFPNIWKQSRCVFLNKDGRSGSSPEHYRPISLLDTVGKIFEKLIDQFGFII